MISTSFADIFKGNALKNSLLPIVVLAEDSRQAVRASGRRRESRSIWRRRRIDAAGWRAVEFPVDPFSKTCLLEGIDELGWILKQESAIATFEADRVGSINTLALRRLE